MMDGGGRGSDSGHLWSKVIIICHLLTTCRNHLSQSQPTPTNPTNPTSTPTWSWQASSKKDKKKKLAQLEERALGWGGFDDKPTLEKVPAGGGGGCVEGPANRHHGLAWRGMRAHGHTLARRGGARAPCPVHEHVYVRAVCVRWTWTASRAAPSPPLAGAPVHACTVMHHGLQATRPSPATRTHLVVAPPRVPRNHLVRWEAL